MRALFLHSEPLTSLVVLETEDVSVSLSRAIRRVHRDYRNAAALRRAQSSKLFADRPVA